MAATEDQPVLASNFFQAQPWSFDDFHSLVEIGKGKDTLIYSAICPKLGDRRVAVKVYDKSKVQATKYRAIKREIAMMMFFMRQRLPTIVEYYGAFQDEAHLYIIMEYCGGGDLLEKLLRDKKAMNEKKVALEVALPCLSILKMLHEMRIIHRDIKLENIFIDEDGCVKLGDFGLTMSMKQESAISPVGTVEYMAPEVVALPPVDLVISGQIKATEIPPTNEKVDIWALGVTIFELVTGRLPFEGKDKAEIKRNITANNLAALPSFLTPQCQSFIRAMLTYGAEERPSCAQLLQHPYITMYYAPPVPKPTPLPNVIALHAYSGTVLGVAVATVHDTGGGQQAGDRGPLDSSSSSSGGGGGGTTSASPTTPRASGLLTYRDALAGGHAQAPFADDQRSPRTPGGSHVPVTVTRNAAASSAQHSPTILAQSGCTSRHAPFSSPLRPQEAAGAAPAVPRKLSFLASGQKPSDAKGGAAAGEHGGLVDISADGQAVEPRQAAQALSPSSQRKRGSNIGSGVKSALRKFFMRRSGQHQHERLEDLDAQQDGTMPATFIR